MASPLRLLIFAALGVVAPGLAGCAPEDTKPKQQPEVRVDLDSDGWPQPEDCDDLNPGVHPEVAERCDGVDNDCDGLVDEAGGAIWYPDGDGDGHGLDDSPMDTCVRAAGAVLLGGDCDDADPTIHPGAEEDCDGVDQDCDGRIDAALRGHDYDDDGFAGAPSLWSACDGPPPVVAYTGDCDDADPLIFPDAPEVCGDGIDSDCDGNVSCVAVSVTTETASCDYVWHLTSMWADTRPCEGCTFTFLEGSPYPEVSPSTADCDPEFEPWRELLFRGDLLYYRDFESDEINLASSTGGWADGNFGFDHTFVDITGPDTAYERWFGVIKLDEIRYREPEDDDIGGRPFTVEGAARTAPAGVRWGGWSAAPAADATQPEPQLQRRIADSWAQLGRMEHASVASFARFSLELLALGAPPALLSEAAVAMADEVRHAQACFGLAEALGGAPVGPGALDVGGSLAHLDRSIDLQAIFTSLLTEACVIETVSAAQAERALAAAVDPAVRLVLAEIVADEARHAAFGWRCAKWMLDAHPELRSVARAVLARLAPADDPLPNPAPDAEPLAHFGLLDARAKARSKRETWQKVIQPAAALLLREGPDCA
jgi:hypothetical protein